MVNPANVALTAYVTCYESCFTKSDIIQEAKTCAAGAAGSTCATKKNACSAVIF